MLVVQLHLRLGLSLGKVEHLFETVRTVKSGRVKGLVRDGGLTLHGGLELRLTLVAGLGNEVGLLLLVQFLGLSELGFPADTGLN